MPIRSRKKSDRIFQATNRRGKATTFKSSGSTQKTESTVWELRIMFAPIGQIAPNTHTTKNSCLGTALESNEDCQICTLHWITKYSQICCKVHSVEAVSPDGEVYRSPHLVAGEDVLFKATRQWIECHALMSSQEAPVLV